MDPTRFDSLTRSLGWTSSRRTALRSGLGALTITAGWLSAAPVSHAKKKRKKKRANRPKCPECPAPPVDVCCAEGQTVCGGTCVDLRTNVSHCGRCGNGCHINARCTDGTCTCIGSNCPDPNWTCCPVSVGLCACQPPANGFMRADTCGFVGASCPAGTTPCVGECATCCPSGTRCDNTTKTCVR
jgi:hypothetical protein